MALARTEFELVGVEAAEARLKKLTVAQNNLERAFLAGRINREQYTKATSGLSTAEQLLAVQLNTTTKQMTAAAAATANIRTEHRQAAESAQLLAGQFGVALPRSVTKFIGSTTLIGPALTAAFNASIVIALAAALVGLLANIDKVTDSLTGLTEEMKKAEQTAADFSRQMDLAMGASPRRAMEFWTQAQRKATEALTAASSQAALQRNALFFLSETYLKLKDDVKRATDALGFYSAIVDQDVIGSTKKATEETKHWIEATKEFHLALAGRGLAAVLAFDTALMDAATSLEHLTLTGKDFKDEKLPDFFSLFGERISKAAGDIRAMESELAIQRAQFAGQSAQAILLQEAKRADETIQHLREIGANEQELAHAREILNQQANVKIAQENKRLFDQMTSRVEGFLNRVVFSAHSFRDFFKNVMNEIKNFFVHKLSQMIAAWLLGMQRMRAEASGGVGGGGGGIFGALLGTLFGGGGFGRGASAAGGGGAAAAAGFAGTIAATSAKADFAHNITAGKVVGGIGGAGGGTATNLSLLEKLGINLHGLQVGKLAIPGGALLSGGLLLGGLGFSKGSALLGALGGAAAGFAFGGPIGAAIGAIVGALAGFLGRGKLKRGAARAEGEVFAQLKQIVEDFKQFKTDYQSALDQFDQTWAAFQQSAPKQFGKYGQRAVANVAPFVGTLRQQMVEIEKTREARTALIGGLGIPEFAAGGFVDRLQAIQSSSGKILAFLHRGEAVLNARAVQALGPSFIEQANRAPGFEQGGMAGGPHGRTVVHIHAGAIVVQAAAGESAEALAKRIVRPLLREIEEQLKGR